jgi:hypothetical protein
MYLLKRVTKTPNGPLRVLVSQPDGTDAGLVAGGSFLFAPAGQPGDQANVTDRTARVIMTDPGLAVHFSCTPPYPGTEPAAQETHQDGDTATAAAHPTRTRGRRAK